MYSGEINVSKLSNVYNRTTQLFVLTSHAVITTYVDDSL